MPKFETTRRVEHTSGNMFDLVADVEKYPQFVPLCDRLVVRRRKTMDDGSEVMIADMTVAYKMLRETFATKVTMSADKSRIDVEYLDGPFSYLQNKWTFVPVGENACEVRFFIEYDFKSRTFAALVGAMFDRAFRKFSEAFEARADEIYTV